MSPLIGRIVQSGGRVKLDNVKVTGVSIPKQPFKENEDWLGSGNNLVVVLDGCGVPDGVETEIERPCRHGLSWFVNTLGTALLRGAGDAVTPLDDALATAIAETASAHQGNCDLTHPHSPAATAVVLRASRGAIEYLVLADATLLIDDGTGDPIVVTDDRLDRLTLPEYDDSPRGSARRLKIARERVDTIAARRNKPDGYPIAVSDPQAAYQAMTGHIKTERVRRAALASNGATRLVDRFAQMSWRQLLDLAQEKGPDAVISRTRDVERSDLEATVWPRERIHDDATLAYCSF